MGHLDPKLTAAMYTHLGVENLRGTVERLHEAQQVTAQSRGVGRAAGPQ